ncbi:hypothetical protein AAF712_003233 [Marasmius tenuissimus]|uniref:Major facilitator superfamily (MFS) profile domain-containing protein n=1 Tax=Marasmius tenuissimus TaxID=585030 RepID=A0ABR3A7S9_9AGAR
MASSQSTAEEGSLATPGGQPIQQSNGLSDQTNYVPRSKIISIFLSCATTSFTTLLDETMIAVALPQINRELGGGSDVAWVATAYFVYVHDRLFHTLVCGRLSDIWSRKTVLFALMVVFSIGNLGAALSTSFIELLVFRAVRRVLYLGRVIDWCRV